MTNFAPAATVRIDKWLWSVRLFKTRQLATDACRFQRISVAGHDAKPARLIKVGDIIEVRLPDITRTVEVTAILENRVGAKLVGAYLNDRTSADEIEAAKKRVEERRLNFLSSPPAKPAKRDRRLMDAFMDQLRASSAIDNGDDED